MRLNVNLTTVLVLGAAGYLYWQYRQNRLFQGMSPELRSYIGQPVRPPIWESWNFGESWGDWRYSGDAAADLQRRFELGAYGTL
ncbi:hypothetical protein [Billgrantia bachuensis]|uniref:Uncharacterized protein n=1 Tax=Billgrantia bachuensis TaxID=2717286 RepID=A0ABX0PL30_9GAMM|nr:hypothetical protein [Halomonas bachuensis]NIC03967.1 hypothetical protein [Halomonas bachuensis]